MTPSTAARVTGDGGGPTTRAAVAAAYRRFWAVAEDLDARPADQWRAVLSTVATNPLLGRILDGLVALHGAGRRQYGRVAPHPTVVAATDRTASVLDCQDASHAGDAESDTGLPISVGSARTPVAATLVCAADGVWRVNEARYLSGAC